VSKKGKRQKAKERWFKGCGPRVFIEGFKGGSKYSSPVL